jgi:hypothetical protein
LRPEAAVAERKLFLHLVIYLARNANAAGLGKTNEVTGKRLGDNTPVKLI